MKCAFIHQIIRLIITKMKVKVKNRLHRHDMNRPSSSNGQKYSKYKRYLTMMMLICIM